MAKTDTVQIKPCPRCSADEWLPLPSGTGLVTLLNVGVLALIFVSVALAPLASGQVAVSTGQQPMTPFAASGVRRARCKKCGIDISTEPALEVSYEGPVEPNRRKRNRFAQGLYEVLSDLF